jgi:hypothetical protein
MLKGLGKGSNRQFFMRLKVGRVSEEGAANEFAGKNMKMPSRGCYPT